MMPKFLNIRYCNISDDGANIHAISKTLLSVPDISESCIHVFIVNQTHACPPQHCNRVIYIDLDDPTWLQYWSPMAIYGSTFHV